MPTYLLTWNPQRWDDWPTFDEDVAATDRGDLVGKMWATGNTRKIQKGDRLFSLRQGQAEPGLVGAGIASGPVEERPHYDEERSAQG